MGIPAANPLFKHFRQPSVYLDLPSMGRFWNETDLDIPPSGQIPVYPMTVKDEITFKTPDALMNGSGVVEVIHSCCPNIKNAWATPTSDIDAILIAIRIASYGNNMDIMSVCPHCGEENENTVDLRILLDSLVTADYSPTVINGLTFNFKPQTFKTMNEANLITFEQEKLIRAINSSELTEEQKLTEFNKIFPTLTDMNVMTIVNCIQSITTEDDVEVTELKLIKEFIYNCDRMLFNQIKEHLEEIAQSQKIKPLTINCSSCTKEYSTDLTFEQSNFFG